MQATELKQRIDRVEQCADEAERAIQSGQPTATALTTSVLPGSTSLSFAMTLPVRVSLWAASIPSMSNVGSASA